jgi:holo-[acyl-carrier protein] synthase
MNVLGIGLDLVETARLASAVERHGDRFLRRIFTDGELESVAGRMASLAARFAAKEAAAKAFGTGIGAAMGFRDIEIIRRPDGCPVLRFHAAAAETARRRGVQQTFVSLTHTDHYAAAQVVLVGGA